MIIFRWAGRLKPPGWLLHFFFEFEFLALSSASFQHRAPGASNNLASGKGGEGDRARGGGGSPFVGGGPAPREFSATEFDFLRSASPRVSKAS